MSLADQKSVIETGWGRRHRLSGGGILPWNYTFIYAPRNETEFEVWKSMVGATVDFCLANLEQCKWWGEELGIGWCAHSTLPIYFSLWWFIWNLGPKFYTVLFQEFMFPSSYNFIQIASVGMQNTMTGDFRNLINLTSEERVDVVVRSACLTFHRFFAVDVLKLISLQWLLLKSLQILFQSILFQSYTASPSSILVALHVFSFS